MDEAHRRTVRLLKVLLPPVWLYLESKAVGVAAGIARKILQRGRADGEGGFAWSIVSILLTGQQDEVGLRDQAGPELSLQLISRSWGLCLKCSQFCGAGLGL